MNENHYPPTLTARRMVLQDLFRKVEVFSVQQNPDRNLHRYTVRNIVKNGRLEDQTLKITHI